MLLLVHIAINAAMSLQGDCLYIQRKVHLHSFSYTSSDKCTYVPSFIHPAINAPTFLQLYIQE